jgi:hypothetical protein
MQAKFISIYDHCKNLARDRQKKMDYIAILHSSEENAKEIIVQQQNLTKSLLALVEKERKTKFIEGNHSYCEQTEPSPVVRQEMAAAGVRIQEQDIDKLVDQLARRRSSRRSSGHLQSTVLISRSPWSTGPDSTLSSLRICLNLKDFLSMDAIAPLMPSSMRKLTLPATALSSGALVPIPLAPSMASIPTWVW